MSNEKNKIKEIRETKTIECPYCHKSHMIMNSTIDIKQMLEDAYQQGYQIGYNKGHDDAKEVIKKKLCLE